MDRDTRWEGVDGEAENRGGGGVRGVWVQEKGERCRNRGGGGAEVPRGLGVGVGDGGGARGETLSGWRHWHEEMLREQGIGA